MWRDDAWLLDILTAEMIIQTRSSHIGLRGFGV